jgi:hypothetical protein
VQVLALVQLPGDPPPVGLIGEVPGGVEGAAQRPVLLDRAGQGVLLPDGTEAVSEPDGRACSRLSVVFWAGNYGRAMLI